MIWIGPGCLHIGEGVFVVPGAAIPADVLPLERLKELEAKGWADLSAEVPEEVEKDAPPPVQLEAPKGEKPSKKKKAKRQKSVKK
jgi:hypothetical protein